MNINRLCVYNYRHYRRLHGCNENYIEFVTEKESGSELKCSARLFFGSLKLEKKESFLLVVSRDTQLRCLSGVEIIKSPTWTTAITSCCRTRHPVKMSIVMEVYPVPYPAQLFTVLSHRCYIFTYEPVDSSTQVSVPLTFLST